MEQQQPPTNFTNVENLSANSTSIIAPKTNNSDLLFKIAKVSVYLFILSALICAIFGIMSIWTSYSTTLSHIDETSGVITTLTFFISIVIRITEGKQKR